MGERLNGIQEVESSILFVSTRTVLDEHLLFLRRFRRKGDDLIHKTETPSCESKTVFFYYILLIKENI